MVLVADLHRKEEWAIAKAEPYRQISHCILVMLNDNLFKAVVFHTCIWGLVHKFLCHCCSSKV